MPSVPIGDPQRYAIEPKIDGVRGLIVFRPDGVVETRSRSGQVRDWQRHRPDLKAQRADEPIGLAEELVRILSRLEGFVVGDPVSTTVGGAPAVQFDVETSAVVEAYLVIPEDQLNVESGDKLRYFAIEREGVLVVLILDVFQKSTFDAAIAQSKPLIDSIAWE